LVAILSRSAGLPGGIVAGQAWECEPFVDLSEYHRAKTGALFAAATAAGAAAAGREPGAWRALGERLGEAYQVADDLRDALGDAADLGKPVGRDAALGRRNAVAECGVSGALARLERLVAEASASVPPCEGAGDLEALIRGECRRFLPAKTARLAA
jgi:geranylgeranyl diphosphate synthase type II